VRSDSQGYTLLELVIGMTLMAMLMTALVIGIGVGSRAWQRGEARLHQTHMDEERASFVTRQVASLVAYRVESPDPDLPGEWPIVEASPSRFRFISTQGSRYWDRAGLVLVEYAVVPASPGTVALALHETPVADDGVLLRSLIEQVGRDPETGNQVVVYRPSSVQAGDLRLMTGLRAARFEYLDPSPRPGAAVWLPKWEGTPQNPFPVAVRLRWEQSAQGGRTMEAGEEIIPLRAQILLPERRLY